MTIDQALQMAFGHHQAGRFHEAEQIYRSILAQVPNHPNALHYLGILAGQSGHVEEGIALIRQALQHAPRNSSYLNSLGNFLREQRKLEEALAAYREAIQYTPGYADAYSNLGNALLDVGRPEEALASYRQAIALKPNYAMAHYNSGIALRSLGQLAEALAAYQQAVKLVPQYPEAYCNMGLVLLDLRRWEEAMVALKEAIRLKPNYPEAYTNLGTAHLEQGQLDDALAAFQLAIQYSPGYAEAQNNGGDVQANGRQPDQVMVKYDKAVAPNANLAQGYINLGLALQRSGRFEEAIAVYQKAIERQPDNPRAYNNLGFARSKTGRLDEALAAYRQAIALNPKYPEAHNNLGNALSEMGQLDEAIAAYRQAIALKPSYTDAHSNLVFAMHYHPDLDAAALAAEHRRWDQQHAQPFKEHIRPHANDRRPDRRLRIGYVSPDFREHVVAYFIKNLLASHDRSQVEVYVYSNVRVPDGMTERLRQQVDVWRDIVRLTDEQAAELIRTDQIDILVDLAMHSSETRLLVFARKPAPVQVTYLAYASGSGLAAMDYRLTDPYLDPPGLHDAHYAEESIRLPETYWCYGADPRAPEPGPLPALAAGHITLGCLNSFGKVSAVTLEAWCHLLTALPNAKLIVHAKEGSHRQRVTDKLTHAGIDPARVQFMGFVNVVEYFQEYGKIDIGLDPFPFTGGTTTCDALWMGVPVVSLAGQTGVSRGGLSILSNVGLPELVAKTPEEYVQIAVDLAHDLPRLAQLRSTLRQRMQSSPLMDAPRFACNVEAAYREMWRKWCGKTD